MHRNRVTRPISIGVRAIDSLLTFGEGQRIGLFAAAGVGKRTLLGMIARNTEAEVNVITLVGERGREVKDFLEQDLGAGRAERSVVVCATSQRTLPGAAEGGVRRHRPSPNTSATRART